MDILGIGFSELMVIMFIALLVFGPRRLPELAAKAGKFVADMRSMSQGLMAEWQREITVAARLEEIEKARQEIKEIQQELKQIPKDISAETTAAKAVVEEMSIAPPRPKTTLPQPKAAEPAPKTDPEAPASSPEPQQAVEPAVTDEIAEESEPSPPVPPQPVEVQPESRSENGASPKEVVNE
jgi:sec-independent protein translocase protein TatB